MKVALIFDHFGPYHLARARAAAEVMDVTCVELHTKSRSYGWDAGELVRDVKLVALPETDLRGAAERKWLEPHLVRALQEAKPDAVAINGWGDFMSAESLRWCVRNGVPAIVMSESTAWDGPRRWYREWLKGRMVKMFSAGLAGGTPQREYLLRLGLPEAAVEIGYDAVDNQYFATKVGEVREELRVKSEAWEGGKVERCEGGKVGTWEDGGAAEGCGVSVDQFLSKPVSEGVEGGDQRPVGRSFGGSGEQLLEDKPRPYFLASARFIPKKNLGRLIEAYADYRRRSMERGAGLPARSAHRSERSGERREQRSEIGGQMSEARDQTLERGGSPWDLVLLGDGPLRGELVKRAVSLGLDVREGAPWECGERENDSVPVGRSTGGSVNPGKETDGRRVGVLWLPGFRQIGELPRFYAGAGCFVHASTTEQWGLVVNEAMACGLPVIVSQRCGCAMDLVQEGVNGFRFDPRDTGQLEALLTKVSGAGFPHGEFAEASRRIIADFGPERFARGMKAATSHALRKGPYRAKAFDRLILDLVCRR